jgi:hypothetical protein
MTPPAFIGKNSKEVKSRRLFGMSDGDRHADRQTDRQTDTRLNPYVLNSGTSLICSTLFSRSAVSVTALACASSVCRM